MNKEDRPLRVADMHCDTAGELFRQRKPLASSDLHISLDKISKYDSYVQFAAIWSDFSKSDDDCYREFFEICNNFKSEVDENGDRASVCRTYGDVTRAISSGKAAFVLTVEGLRLVGNDISRIEKLYGAGVRVATLTWAGSDGIGGSHDTDLALTDFGKEALDECFRIGIIPDISHLSHRGMKEVFEAARRHSRPILATHSNSAHLCSVGRNLTDDEFRKVADLGGLVGISLYPGHLSRSDASASVAADHICRYVDLAGDGSVALGCDFDGIESTPRDISDVSELDVLASELSKRSFSDDCIDRIFFGNVLGFLERNLN